MPRYNVNSRSKQKENYQFLRPSSSSSASKIPVFDPSNVLGARTVNTMGSSNRAPPSAVRVNRLARVGLSSNQKESLPIRRIAVSNGVDQDMLHIMHGRDRDAVPPSQDIAIESPSILKRAWGKNMTANRHHQRQHRRPHTERKRRHDDETAERERTRSGGQSSSRHDRHRRSAEHSTDYIGNLLHVPPASTSRTHQRSVRSLNQLVTPDEADNPSTFKDASSSSRIDPSANVLERVTDPNHLLGVCDRLAEYMPRIALSDGRAHATHVNEAVYGMFMASNGANISYAVPCTLRRIVRRRGATADYSSLLSSSAPPASPSRTLHTTITALFGARRRTMDTSTHRSRPVSCSFVDVMADSSGVGMLPMYDVTDESLSDIGEEEEDDGPLDALDEIMRQAESDADNLRSRRMTAINQTVAQYEFAFDVGEGEEEDDLLRRTPERYVIGDGLDTLFGETQSSYLTQNVRLCCCKLRTDLGLQSTVRSSSGSRAMDDSIAALVNEEVNHSVVSRSPRHRGYDDEDATASISSRRRLFVDDGNNVRDTATQSQMMADFMDEQPSSSAHTSFPPPVIKRRRRRHQPSDILML